MNPLHSIPRLRMFAGPNGSGKSTIKSDIKEELLGYYINPDEIEAEIKKSKFLDFNNFQIHTNEIEVLNFFNKSTLLKKANLLNEAAKLTCDQNHLSFLNLEVNAYFASVAADFIRRKLISQHQSFTFETVMSSSDKVDLLQKVQQDGYRTYLYFVATEDPNINISRVQNRVKTGGHDVPADKIITRYYRSLELLWEAVKHTNRAYIFDNSKSELLWLAEITNA
jgi:predicted ABC-type ATPase